MKWFRDIYCPERKVQVNVRGAWAWKDVGVVEVQVQTCNQLALGKCQRYEKGDCLIYRTIQVKGETL